jgi:hypothetical protein
MARTRVLRRGALALALIGAGLLGGCVYDPYAGYPGYGGYAYGYGPAYVAAPTVVVGGGWGWGRWGGWGWGRGGGWRR